MIFHVALPDGTGENVVDQSVKPRWGRVTEVRTLEDTRRLARALEGPAASGYSGAVAGVRPRPKEAA